MAELAATRKGYFERAKKIEAGMKPPREGSPDLRDQPVPLPTELFSSDAVVPGVTPRPKRYGKGPVDEPEEPIDQADRKIEVQLINQLASRKDWVIPNRAYTSVPQMLVEVAEDDGAETKLRILAANALSKLHGQNTDKDRNTTHFHLARVRIEGAKAPEAPEIDPSSIGSSALLEAPSLDDLRQTVELLSNLGIMDTMIGKTHE